MSQEYIIKAVKQKPKEWSSQYGPMLTWLIQVEGNGEPVQLNKKANSPQPQVGDTIFGKIEESEYGQKFKSAPKPFGSSTGGYAKSPEDRDSIYRCNALNNAVAFLGQLKAPELTSDILSLADQFYAWLKGESPKVPALSNENQTKTGPKDGHSEIGESTMTTSSGHDKAKAVAESLKKPPVGSSDDDNDLSWIRDEGE